MNKLISTLLLLLIASNTLAALPLWELVSKKRNYDALRQIKNGTNINETNGLGWTPLLISVRKNPNFTSQLLSLGADPNIKNNADWSPLLLAMKENEILVPVLINNGADVTATRGNTSAFQLLLKSNPVALKEGLKNIEDINKANSLGYTPLEYAIKADDIEIARVIISLRGNVNLRSAFTLSCHQQALPQPTPIEFAQQCGSKQMVSLLNNHIAIVKAATNNNSKLQTGKPHNVKNTNVKNTCTVHLANWVYTSNSCVNGQAEGYGKALLPENQHYEGVFIKGLPKQGALYNAGKLVYQGSFEQGQPHGMGMCASESGFIKCTYHNGKRI